MTLKRFAGPLVIACLAFASAGVADDPGLDSLLEDGSRPTAGVSGSGASPASGSAQPTAQRPRSSGVIEEVIVTARKTEENLQDVPVSVTALTGEALAETSTFEVKDLGMLVPNLTTPPGPGQGTAVRFQIRGQIQNDILGTLDPSVGFYDDGIYVARPHGANAMFFDVDSIQVLRGPQGTLFGRNTTGGAILLGTNDPSFEGVSGSVGGGLGSFDRRMLGGVLNAPILENVLALRIAAQTVTSDGFATDAFNGRKIGSEGSDLIRLKLRYEPRDDLSFVLKGQHVGVDFLGPPLKAVFALDPEDATNPGVCCLLKANNEVEIASGGPDYDDFVGGSIDRANYDSGLKPVNEMTVREVALTSVWDSPWATFKLVTGIRQNDDAGNRIDIDGSPSVGVDTLQANENLQQSYELQATGRLFAERLGWAAGVYYFDEDGKERATTGVFLPTAQAISPIRTFGDIVNDSVGGYVQGTYSLTPRLRLTGGVRHTRDGKELLLRAFMGDSCGVPEELRDGSGECQGTFDDSFSNTSFTTAVDYQLFEDAFGFVDDTLVYTSVSSGYRSGGQNLRGTSVETLTPFKPETLLQIEGGFKSQLFGRRVRLNAAGFHTFYDDIQRSIIVASDSFLPATVVSNAASAEISGAEIELLALGPIDNLELGANFGLTLARYNEFVDASGDRSNERFDFVPETSYSLSAAYTWFLSGVPFLDGAPWRNRLDWSWTDDVPSSEGGLQYFRDQGFDLGPLVTQPALGILNFRSGLRLGNGLDLAFFVRNLAEERTFTSLVLGGGPDFATKLVTNAPRELGFEAGYHF